MRIEKSTMRPGHYFVFGVTPEVTLRAEWIAHRKPAGRKYHYFCLIFKTKGGEPVLETDIPESLLLRG
jgi:hypothetical protein